MLQSEWNRLITNYKKTLKRKVSKSGDAGNKRPPKSEFFNELSWLKDLYTPRDMQSNLVPITNEENSSPPPQRKIQSPLQQEVMSPQASSSTFASPSSPAVSLMSSVSSIETLQLTCSKSKGTGGFQKRSHAETVDILLAKALNDHHKKDDSTKYIEQKEEDSDVLFCRSLVQPL